MKIATFNINNINKRLSNLLTWLRQAEPDVVCLQELKAADAEFPKSAIEKLGYGAVWRGEKSWNGVAILARGVEPIVTRTALPGDGGDSQARYIEAAVNGVLIASLYAPNGNPQPGPKFSYKLAWMKRLAAHMAELYAADVPAVVAGDYNVVPTDRDIYKTKSYAKNALLQPAPRKQFQEILGQGWTDAIRTLHPDAPMYTFWDYFRNHWQRDGGMRIDHLLLSRKSARTLVEAGVDRDVRGGEGASDHAPAWVILRDLKAKKAAPAPRQKPQRNTDGTERVRTSGKKTATAAKRRSARPLLVIDGDSFAHRSYHALPKSIQTSDGRPAGALLGFANFLLRVYQAEEPRAVLVGWDTLEEPTYRHEEFPDYQGGRDFDDAIVEQLEILPTFVAACGFANARHAGYEADDFLAAAVKAEEKRGGTVLVASGDRDTFQLASDPTTILFPIRGGGLERIGPAEVRKRYGVEPALVPDFIALRGDPSDKLPGAPGVGPAGAADILRRYGTLEAALAAGRFPGLAKELRLYRRIATMNPKAPLPRLPDQTPTWDKAATLARRWGLNQLAERLGKL